MDHHNERVLDLEEYCSPSNVSLSLDVLREKLSPISAIQTSSSHFLHELCLHENVTLEMVESVLEFNPYAAYFCSNRYHGIEYDEDDIEAYEAEHENQNEGSDVGPDSGTICSDRSYPIHLACANAHCPNSVIRLLAKSNPSALGHLCLLLREHGIYATYGDEIEGVPLHYYLSRAANMDLDTVKTLIDECPNSLMMGGRGDEAECFPIHVLVDNPNVGTFCDIVHYLVKMNPIQLQCIDVFRQVPLHVACYNKHMTENVIQILVDGWQEPTQQSDCTKSLPLHHLCKNEDLNDTAKLNILGILTDANPESLAARNSSYCLPIRIASRFHCPDFCESLVYSYHGSVKVADYAGNLPFHIACESGRLDIVKYLFEAYPQSNFVRNKDGLYPLHMALRTSGQCQAEIVQFLLMHEPDCASKPVAETILFSGFLTKYLLPLHLACNNRAKLSTVKVLFDAYPSAIEIDIRPPHGESPLQIARRWGNRELVLFLEQQLQDTSTYDSNPDTPIHHALRNNVTLGVIKLIADKCPDSVSALDTDQNSSLHCACRIGRCDVVNYLLNMKVGLVSEQNRAKKLPLELLLEAGSDSNGVEHTEAIWRLLVAHPEILFLG